MTLTKVLFVAFILSLTACGSPSDSENKETNLPHTITDKSEENTGNQETNVETVTQQTNNQQPDVTTPQTNAPINSGSTVYDYLNQLRESAGLIPLKENNLLAQASNNHANYLISNDSFGHDESIQLTGFTGVSAADRVNSTNYFSRTVGEGISTGKTDNHAIDNLFSAIYHRFTLMSPVYNEIGIASSQEVNGNSLILVHNMANSGLNQLCQQAPFSGFGTFYENVCKNEVSLEAAAYDQALTSTRIGNDSIIVWPPVNGKDIPPAFFEETPDPLSDYGVSGYPVSIVFNGHDTDEFLLENIYLYNDNTNQLVTDTRLLNQDTDPNQSFSTNQHALFPLQRLDWNTRYRVEISYRVNNTLSSKTWTFQTREPATKTIKLAEDQSSFSLEIGVKTALYIPPQNPFDTLSAIKVSSPQNVNVALDFFDQNTLLIYATGTSNATINITLDDGIDAIPRVLTAEINV